MQSQFLSSLLNLLDAHSDEHWDLDRLAERTGYSKYHLCRAFHAATHEPLQTYLRRLRLAKAAADLKRDVRVIDIALECGYQSQEAFHRAFKKMFGMTPKAFQSGEHHASLLLKKPWNDALMPPNALPVSDATLEAFTVFGLGGNYSYEQIPQIEKLWQHFSEFADSGSATYGVTLPPPGGAGFKYFAASQKKIPELSDNLVKVKIPAQDYKVFSYTGPASGVLRALNYIWGVWLPEQTSVDVDLQGIDFEYYPPGYDPHSDSSWVDIYVPIIKREPLEDGLTGELAN
jgi:AraC family transcriptional regulator